MGAPSFGELPSERAVGTGRLPYVNPDTGNFLYANEAGFDSAASKEYWQGRREAQQAQQSSAQQSSASNGGGFAGPLKQAVVSAAPQPSAASPNTPPAQRTQAATQADASTELSRRSTRAKARTSGGPTVLAGDPNVTGSGQGSTVLGG